MVSTIVHQLTRGLSVEEIEKAGLAPYYVDHTVGIWPQAAGGIPFNACEFQSKGDAITDLYEDMAAEQKALLSLSCRRLKHQTSFLQDRTDAHPGNAILVPRPTCRHMYQVFADTLFQQYL